MVSDFSRNYLSPFPFLNEKGATSNMNSGYMNNEWQCAGVRDITAIDVVEFSILMHLYAFLL